MSKKEVPLEVTLAREVKSRYFNKGHALGYRYPDNPFRTLREDWLRECFAEVARNHGLRYHRSKLPCDLNDSEVDDRRQYVFHLRLVRRSLQRSICIMEKNRVKVSSLGEGITPKAQPQPRSPFQAQGACSNPEAAIQRLKALHTEIAARPVIRY